MANLYHPPLGKFGIYNEKQIWGKANYIPDSQGYIVPNVGDKVLRYIKNVIEVPLRVTAVGEAPEYYVELTPIQQQGGESEFPVLYPVGSANLGAVNICYLNPTDNKFPACFHVDMLFRADKAIYGKLFLGTDASESGIIISRNLDVAGVVADDKIMFRREDPNDPSNMRYVPSSFNIDRKLAEDTMVTLALYNDRDMECGFFVAAIKYNHAVGNVSSRSLFITDIEMVTVFDNPAVAGEILVPISMLNSSFNPRVFKVYHTGQREEILLNSPNLHIGGWGNYVIGDSGEDFPIVVKYHLQPGERSDNVDIFNGGTISKTYKGIITDSSMASDFKVMVAPIFSHIESNYSLKAYLYSSTYDVMMDVSDAVQLDREFDGKNFVDYQTFNLSLDLRTIAEVQSNTVVTGSFGIRLKGVPLDVPTAYQLYPHPTDETRFFGEHLRAKVKEALGSTSVSISNNIAGFPEFLEQLYYRLEPPYETELAAFAPEPTHCDITIDGHTVTMDVVNNWDGSVLWTAAKPQQGAMAIIHWYLVDSDNVRRDLAVCSIPTEVI